MEEKICDLCSKKRGDYNGCVWYGGDIETLLCKSCHLKWIKSKELREFKKNNIEPDYRTHNKEFKRYCHRQQLIFNNWKALKEE